jgi:hypothetical protein
MQGFAGTSGYSWSGAYELAHSLLHRGTTWSSSNTGPDPRAGEKVLILWEARIGGH